jgi:aspartate aminotransferase-like enzyme
MHIKKLRLLTPGPTPLYPKALHAMMGSDIHHRTEDFRNLYRTVLADLEEVMGTSERRALAGRLRNRGHGILGIEPVLAGDKVIVCSAGKFGERWVEITKAFGLDAVVFSAEYGDVVTPDRVEAALKENPNARGVFVQASETSTGASHDVKSMARRSGRRMRSSSSTRLRASGTQPLDIDGWGLDVVIGGSQKAFMIPPGLAFISVSQKAWAFSETAKLPRYYFNLKKERKNAAAGESSWTPATSLSARVGRSAEVHQERRHGQTGGQRAATGARHSRSRHGVGSGTVLAQVAGRFGDGDPRTARAWIRA